MNRRALLQTFFLTLRMQLICGRGIHPGRSGQSRSIGARCSSFSEGLRVGQQHVKLVLLQNTMDFYITVAFVIPLSFPSFPSPAHRPGGGFYQLRSASSAAPHEPRQHTQQPIVTGTHPRAHVFLFLFLRFSSPLFFFFFFFPSLSSPFPASNRRVRQVLLSWQSSTTAGS